MKKFDANRVVSLRGGISLGAADVGYGYTKFGFNNRDGAKFNLSMFTSRATISPEQNDTGRVRVGGGIDVVRVKVGEKYYEVGPDSNLNQGERTLGDNYIEQPEHLALLKGALAYSKKEFFDLFVVGLPVTHMRSKEKIESLKEMVKGTHELNDGRVCEIKNVVVLPQPQGAFLSHSMCKEKWKMKKERTLVIDPGQFTWDFFMCEGGAVVDHMCGSHNHSMNKILSDMCQNIGTEIGGHFNGMQKLEEGFGTGEIKIKQRSRKIEEFISQKTDSLIKTSVVKMANNLDDLELLDNVIICGGAGKLFKSTIEEVLGVQADVADDPIFENIRGYLLAAAIKGKEL